MATLLWAKKEHNDSGQQTGLTVRYLTNGLAESSCYFTMAEINGKSAAEIRTVAQAIADADTTISGTVEDEDIVANRIKGLLEIAESEIAFLDENIPVILTLTTVAQLRIAVHRLAQENRAIIRAMARMIDGQSW